MSSLVGGDLSVKNSISWYNGFDPLPLVTAYMYMYSMYSCVYIHVYAGCTYVYRCTFFSTTFFLSTCAHNHTHTNTPTPTHTHTHTLYTHTHTQVSTATGDPPPTGTEKLLSGGQVLRPLSKTPPLPNLRG